MYVPKISLSETLLTMVEAAAACPCRRGGKKTHSSTIFRWTTSGCRGVRLESIQVGASRMTSREALERFFAELTRRRDEGEDTAGAAAMSPSPSPGGRTPAQRKKGHESSMARLAAQGME